MYKEIKSVSSMKLKLLKNIAFGFRNSTYSLIRHINGSASDPGNSKSRKDLKSQGHSEEIIHETKALINFNFPVVYRLYRYITLTIYLTKKIETCISFLESAGKGEEGLGRRLDFLRTIHNNHVEAIDVK